MITVAAGLIERNGRVLIARRKNGVAHGLKWEFPGGKVEPNESPKECVQRELQEELGIRVEVGSLFCLADYDYPDFSIRLAVYCVSSLAGEPIALEHDEIRWVTPEEIEAYDFPEADLPVVARVAARASGSSSLCTED
jgi:8-oxo-dGTP diphosphatase